ncbi:hypothetical protein HYH02_002307 [Chlamydomonas schloesseri]|uniref:Glycosyl transferase family 1 domain-containing protein n=1 Tax=Chlamydomonas schloesseri TaxID=2026947 RepID=A0A835WUZ6_9CHLO|nr:hypothetical protein HYH02_002307 [Chlamydomonas schloesseri]|eukprot:KAG2452970.1 hypothetical protein HYH02_002307 [Chlamydomonas schloesseri]
MEAGQQQIQDEEYEDVRWLEDMMRARDEEAAAAAASEPDALDGDTPPSAAALAQPRRRHNSTRPGSTAATTSVPSTTGEQFDDIGPSLSIWSSLHAAAASGAPYGHGSRGGGGAAANPAAAFVAAALGLPTDADAETLQAVVEAAAKEQQQQQQDGQDVQGAAGGGKQQAALRPAPAAAARSQAPSSVAGQRLGQAQVQPTEGLPEATAGIAAARGGTGPYASALRLQPPEPPRYPSAGNASAAPSEPAPLNFPVWWMAPFWSGSGYSSEAINYVLSLTRAGQVRPEDVWIGHHGDVARDKVVAAMAPEDRSELQALEAQAGGLHSPSPLHPPVPRAAVVVCHSLPTNWQLPEPTSGADDQCPPAAVKAGYVYLVGRTMFETDRLPRAFVARCNSMNEVWVPSAWAVEVFAASGVDPAKLVVLPEGINTTWYDPDLYEPMPLPQGSELVFGEPPPPPPPSPPPAAGAAAGKETSRPYRLLSAFKWEPRKGWDVLLEAYLTEFTAQDNIELYIITKPFVGNGDFKQHMHNWLKRAQRRLGLPADVLGAAGRLPRLYVISHHISDADFPRYYKAADAFVLPSRGEGWGRPHVEAMSMGLPLLATNWSGITAYLDPSVGYPIAVERLITVADNSVWWFRGLKWAQPSVKHTRQLMRHVFSHREEARAKGAAARRRMVERYSPPVLAAELAAHLRRIDSLIPPLPPPV